MSSPHRRARLRRSLAVTDVTVPVATSETPMIMRNRVMRGEVASSLRSGRPPSSVVGEASESVHRSFQILTEPSKNDGISENWREPEGDRENFSRTIPRRRSSIGLRGKRASLSSSALSQPPHETVPTAEFYRHIDAEQSDPIRMRQLLVWCAHRAKDSMSTIHDSTDPLVFKLFEQVQEALIQGLAKRKINTSWYHRTDQFPNQCSVYGMTLPNPQNTRYEQKRVEKTVELQRLRKEESLWATLSSASQRDGGEPASRTEQICFNDGEAYSYLSEKEKMYFRTISEADRRSESSVLPQFESILDDFELKVLEISALADDMKEEVSASRQKCERLFSSWIRAHDSELHSRRRIAEPMELLRLIC